MEILWNKKQYQVRGRLVRKKCPMLDCFVVFVVEREDGDACERRKCHDAQGVGRIAGNLHHLVAEAALTEKVVLVQHDGNRLRHHVVLADES